MFWNWGRISRPRSRSNFWTRVEIQFRDQSWVQVGIQVSILRSGRVSELWSKLDFGFKLGSRSDSVTTASVGFGTRVEV